MWNNVITFAAAANPCASPQFFGLKPWYYYLTRTANKSGGCDLSFNVLGNGKTSDILLILLAVVDDLLVIAGLVTVGYVIYAGIKYVTSQGSPEETAKAQSTLVNALLGLALALVAVAGVSFLGSHIGGSHGSGANTAGLDLSSLPQTSGQSSTVNTILGIVFAVAGALALLFITIGGFRYVLSQGDPQATAKARNTILYAVIGLVVVVIARTLVAFVFGRVA